MRIPIILTLTICLSILGSPSWAGTIYTWTDADGVKRYSNSQPPEDVEDVQTIDEVEYDDTDAESRRRDFDRMAEEAGEEADKHFESQARQQARQEAQQKKRKEEARNQQIAAEKARLMKKIEALQNRGLGPNFTKGMRDNLIRPLQDKLDQLEKDSAN